MDKKTQCIIIGGGHSVTEGLNKDLWNKISNKFTVGCNYSYRYYNSTLLCFIDNDFYEQEFINLSNLELIVGKCSLKNTHPNTIAIPHTNEYNRGLTKGIYGALTGVYALSLAIYLLDVGEIFMLGMDFGAKSNDIKCPIKLKEITYKGNILTAPRFIVSKSEGKLSRPLTHWYQDELEHRGVGQIGYYYIKDKVTNVFKAFEGETKCKIYNVGLDSRIEQFEKISYDSFFSKLDNEVYNQEELVREIRGKLSGLI